MLPKKLAITTRSTPELALLFCVILSLIGQCFGCTFGNAANAAAECEDPAVFGTNGVWVNPYETGGWFVETIQRKPSYVNAGLCSRNYGDIFWFNEICADHIEILITKWTPLGGAAVDVPPA